MKGTKSKRREMATLLCSLGAIAIGGIAADAWADDSNNFSFIVRKRECFVCIGRPVGFACTYSNANQKLRCDLACDRAQCSYDNSTKTLTANCVRSPNCLEDGDDELP